MNQTRQKHDGEEEHTTTPKYREVGLKRHITVRIPRGIAEAVEGFLKTEQAAKMGFDSKADVVTAAVRKMLTDYGYYQIQRKEIKKARARVTRKDPQLANSGSKNNCTPSIKIRIGG